MLRYRQINSIFYTDTMFATKDAKSTRGNKCCQVFESDKGFVVMYPKEKPSQFEDALHLFCKEKGVPITLVADPYPSQTKGGLESIGKLATIVRALYGGKSTGADYWRHVRSPMTNMNFKACPVNPGVWMYPGAKADGSTHWQYVLLYIDDILAIMEEPEKFIREELMSYFTI